MVVITRHRIEGIDDGNILWIAGTIVVLVMVKDDRSRVAPEVDAAQHACAYRGVLAEVRRVALQGRRNFQHSEIVEQGSEVQPSQMSYSGVVIW